MNALREIYDFITGGSIAAPVGMAVACATLLVPALAPGTRAIVFVGVLVLTLVLASYERVR